MADSRRRRKRRRIALSHSEIRDPAERAPTCTLVLAINENEPNHIAVVYVMRTNKRRPTNESDEGIPIQLDLPGRNAVANSCPRGLDLTFSADKRRVVRPLVLVLRAHDIIQGRYDADFERNNRPADEVASGLVNELEKRDKKRPELVVTNTNRLSGS